MGPPKIPNDSTALAGVAMAIKQAMARALMVALASASLLLSAALIGDALGGWRGAVLALSVLLTIVAIVIAAWINWPPRRPKRQEASESEPARTSPPRSSSVSALSGPPRSDPEPESWSHPSPQSVGKLSLVAALTGFVLSLGPTRSVRIGLRLLSIWRTVQDVIERDRRTPGDPR